MCPSGATCLPVDCCFSELALWKSNSACWSSTKRISSSCHWKLTCSRHEIAENCWIGVKQQSLTHCIVILLKSGTDDYFSFNWILVKCLYHAMSSTEYLLQKTYQILWVFFVFFCNVAKAETEQWGK